LIGTVAIEKNELLSAYLTQEGVGHQALNAKNHQSEGEIVAQAGKLGAVTIATNMAGRGVDIKLGGNPATVEQGQEVKDLGGLFVLGLNDMMQDVSIISYVDDQGVKVIQERHNFMYHLMIH